MSLANPAPNVRVEAGGPVRSVMAAAADGPQAKREWAADEKQMNADKDFYAIS
jgi:hypothetical protein